MKHLLTLVILLISISSCVNEENSSCRTIFLKHKVNSLEHFYDYIANGYDGIEFACISVIRLFLSTMIIHKKLFHLWIMLIL